MRSSRVRPSDVPLSTARRFIAVASWCVALLACAGGAYGARRLVASEWLDDQASLAVTLGTGLAVAAAALAAFRLTLRRTGWRRRLAAAFVPAGFVCIGAAFTAASLPDASVEMQAIVDAREPQAPPATVELGPGGKDIRLSGELREGVARRLAALLDANPRVGRIHLTSEGGLADEGQALGDVIAAHRLTTFVPDYCVSACTLAFVRGRERLLFEESRVGFHAPFEQGLFGAVYQDDSSQQRAEYIAAGVDRDFVDTALRVKPDDIWFPDAARLIASHVATAVVPRDRLPDSTLDGSATLEGAKAAVLRNYPLLAAFRARVPAALDQVAGWYLEAYRHGRSESDDADDLRVIAGSAVLVALARADDAELTETGRYLARGMAAANDPEACLRIASEADLVEAAAQLEPHDDQAEARAETIVAAAAGGHHEIGPQRGGGPLAALADGAGEPDAARCTAARRAYDDLLRRPPARAAAVLRRLAESRALRSLDEVKIIVARR